MPRTTPRASAPHIEPSEIELREGVPTRVDLVFGDKRLPMVLTLRGNGHMEMSVVDADQEWFWSEGWLEGELEADEDIDSGHVVSYTEDEFLKVVRDY